MMPGGLIAGNFNLSSGLDPRAVLIGDFAGIGCWFSLSSGLWFEISGLHLFLVFLKTCVDLFGWLDL
ncbi:hypothetical protein E2F50_18665 [Rhizobium deserti]|uniref:Uncharacterized protein n=1 Tax=Rhizobium deserti TaxID=2547961 RepID=A0A4R5UA66_9HYPH|nr:hypothetical protein [Rhizobium deserti]TDK31701.1 hypothetical protein E2F50_18665 [Rhizobium deserti]